VSDLQIPMIGQPILMQPNMQNDPGKIKIAHRYMNGRTGNMAELFHFWENIDKISGTVRGTFTATENILSWWNTRTPW
jgi:hypothetical protein